MRRDWVILNSQLPESDDSEVISSRHARSCKATPVNVNCFSVKHTIIRKLTKECCEKLQRKNFLSNQWNALQDNTVTAPTVESFKIRVDKELNCTRRATVHYLWEHLWCWFVMCCGNSGVSLWLTDLLLLAHNLVYIYSTLVKGKACSFIGFESPIVYWIVKNNNNNDGHVLDDHLHFWGIARNI